MTENTIKEKNAAISFWTTSTTATENQASILDATTCALYRMAEAKMADATVNSVAGVEHSAMQYAMQMYIEAENIIGDQKDAQLSNHLAQCALLVALEESFYTGEWLSYGSKLLFEVKRAGIKLTRPVIAAFLAQEGSWSKNLNKGDLMDGNIVAVSIYCARLSVLCHRLDGYPTCWTSDQADNQAEQVKTLAYDEVDSIAANLNYYLNKYAVAYLQEKGSKDAQKQVAVFIKYLETQSDFYTAPSSTKYHLSVDGGLAQHTNNVLMQLLYRVLPATPAQLGACVLAAIGHDLCKIGVYKKQFKSKKVYLSEGEPAPEAAFIKTDGGGNFYWADSYYYEFSDAMPFGHGRKSAYMLQGFFPEIDEDVFAAVVCHMADPESNPHYLYKFVMCPLALNLHIADVLAASINEYEG